MARVPRCALLLFCAAVLFVVALLFGTPTPSARNVGALVTATAVLPPAPTSNSGVTGKLFLGETVRTFTELLIFDGRERHIERALAREGLQCARWAVVTTIHAPGAAVLDLADGRDGWCLVVVGDEGTPAYALPAATGVYLDVARQRAMANDFAPLLELLPWRHFGRKNVGYLFAILHGAQLVWDFDDDNGRREGAALEVPARARFIVPLDSGAQVPCRAFNPYPHMGAPSSPSWPRGMPLNLIKAPCDIKLAPPNVETAATVGVFQSLANHEPDVDGIFRLVLPIPFNWSESTTDVLVLPPGVFAPYNAQAQLSTYRALWALLLPVSVHGRVSDIWRGYFAQRLMWDVGLHVAFTPPLVTQIRNPHDALADMLAEGDLYKKSLALIRFLSRWQGTGATLQARYEELYVALYERDFIGLTDVLLAQQWLLALERAGYDFPPLISPTQTRIFEGVLTAVSAKSAAAPRWCPFKDGQRFRCDPIFNHGFYTKTYVDAAHLDAAAAAAHYETVGVLAGRRSHASQKIMKIILMTMNEWPLLKSFVLYHAEVFGAENVYVFDSSTRADIRQFLDVAKADLGVNVLYVGPTFDEALESFNSVMTELKPCADFLVKLDTDEFLVLTNTNTTTGRHSFSVDGLLEYLDGLEMNGSRYINGFSSNSFPRDGCGVDDNIALVHEFEHPSPSSIKVFFAAPAFKYADLGCHTGEVVAPFNVEERIPTRLGLAHFHMQCFEAVQANNRKAMVMSKFVQGGRKAEPTDADILEAINILSKNGTECQFGSCHKALSYRTYLMDPVTTKQLYNSRKFLGKDHPGMMFFDDIEKILTVIFRRFDAQYA